MSAAASALRGHSVVVTRPVAQAVALAAAIEREGGIVLRFPVLEIGDAPDAGPLREAARDIERFDLAVFVSPNAVERALGVITARRPWPQHVRAAVMGRTSAQALQRHGVHEVLLPVGGSDSEALLALPALQAERMRGCRVAIFCGDGGRELLAETLAARGARVERVTCYRRGRPAIDAAPLRGRLALGAVDAVTVSSSEGLRNLVDMVGAEAAPRLKALPLFVPHARIGAAAAALGFAQVVRTAPGDEGLLAGLHGYFEKRGAGAADPSADIGP